MHGFAGNSEKARAAVQQRWENQNLQPHTPRTKEHFRLSSSCDDQFWQSPSASFFPSFDFFFLFLIVFGRKREGRDSGGERG